MNRHTYTERDREGVLLIPLESPAPETQRLLLHRWGSNSEDTADHIEAMDTHMKIEAVFEALPKLNVSRKRYSDPQTWS